MDDTTMSDSEEPFAMDHDANHKSASNHKTTFLERPKVAKRNRSSSSISSQSVNLSLLHDLKGDRSDPDAMQLLMESTQMKSPRSKIVEASMRKRRRVDKDDDDVSHVDASSDQDMLGRSESAGIYTHYRDEVLSGRSDNKLGGRDGFVIQADRDIEDELLSQPVSLTKKQTDNREKSKRKKTTSNLLVNDGTQSRQAYRAEPTAFLTIRRNKAIKDAQKVIGDASKTGKYAIKRAAQYSEPYRQLLNSDIKDARQRTIYDFKGTKRLRASYILGSLWSKEEKNSFFNALPRIGKDDVEALAAEVKTKSVLECRAYIHVLKEELAAKLSTSRGFRKLFTLTDIPAAIELSEDCIKALDIEAGRLETFTRKQELRTDNKIYGHYTVLSANTGYRSEGAWNDTEGAETKLEEVSKITSSADLLSLDTFLTLSERFFMAGSNDFRKFVPIGRYPSIRNQAFTDLHSLAVSLTRRLIQTALYQAHCRIHAMEQLSGSRAPQVLKKDVLTTIEILGLTLNSEEYWSKVPRRCDLIIEKPGASKGKRRTELLLDEVEDSLQVFEDIEFGIKNEDGSGSDSEIRTKDRDSESDKELEESEMESENGEADELYPSLSNKQDNRKIKNQSIRLRKIAASDEIDYAMYFEDKNISKPKPLLREIQTRLEREALEDTYLESLDNITSLKREKDLWIILGGAEDIINDIETQIRNHKLVAKPRIYRENFEDRVDWRDDCADIPPIWGQNYYRELWEAEGAGRRRRKGNLNDADREATQEDNVEVAPASLARNLVVSKKDAQREFGEKKTYLPLTPLTSSTSSISPSPVIQSQRQFRPRRPSTRFVGFVSTVENISDHEAVVPEYTDTEDDIAEYEPEDINE